MSHTIVLRSKNRVVLPLEVVEDLGAKVGDILLVDSERGRATLTRAKVTPVVKG